MASKTATHKTLKKGSYTFSNPAFMGGAKVTLRAGEPVGEKVFRHVPEADHRFFEDAPAKAVEEAKAASE